MGDRVAHRLGSVRVRTTLATTVVVGVALAVGGVVLVGLLRSSLTDNVETAASLRAADVVALLDAGDAPGALTVDGEESSLVQVLDRAGAVVAASANVEGETRIASMRPGDARTLRSTPIGDEHEYRAVARSSADGRFIVLVARTLEPVEDSTSVVTRSLAAGIPSLLLLVAATSWVLTGRALRPVEAIRREVAAISGSELDRRVPTPAGDDEIGRLARTMNEMLDRLQASRDRQRRFVADASHELRSPIASIRHQLEVALAHPEHRTFDLLATDLLADDLRMQHLVDDLLLLARADEETLTAVREPVDLDDLVFAEATRLRQHGVTRVDTSGVSAGRLRGDASQLERLLRNLADNAERHAASVVTFALHAENGTVTLSVDDDGVGVADADRTRVFERFTRLDDARARDAGGAGLGLAIVAEVAHSHGGTVRIEGDRGSRFVVVLPGADAG